MMKTLAEVRQIPILDKKVCTQLSEDVHRNFSSWQRIPWPGTREAVPFFALGQPAYFYKKDRAAYRQQFKKANPLLMDEFGWLYSYISTILEEVFSEKFIYRQDAGLPGFHIMKGHSAFQKNGGKWHVDFDYEYLNWKQKIDIQESISFTLPIDLPQVGANFEFIHESAEAPPKNLKECEQHKVRAQKFEIWSHQVGHLLLQRGPIVHRIAQISPRAGKEFSRITFQGLAVKQGKHWEIFW